MQCLTPDPKEYLVPIPESDYTDHITYTTYIAVRSIHGHRGGTRWTVVPNDAYNDAQRHIRALVDS